MDPVVREAWLGILEKRYRAEKRLLKTAIAAPKELKRIILEYSRIDPSVFNPFSADELYYQSKYPEINDDLLDVSIRISHIGAIRHNIENRWHGSCMDNTCMVFLSHIGIHISNEGACGSHICISPNGLFSYILTGGTRDWKCDISELDYAPVSEDDSDKISHMIAPLFDVIIWPVLQKLPANHSYSGYELCDCEQ